MKIGVLALQGAFKEHIDMLESLGIQCYELRKKEDLEKRRQKEKNTNIQQQRNKKSGA